MWNKKKNVIDERIKKEHNHLTSKMFYVTIVLTAVSLAIKLMAGLPAYTVLLEILVLVGGIGYYLVAEIGKGIFLMKQRDEALQEIHEDNLAKAYMIQFWFLIIGQFLFMLVAPNYLFLTLLYLCIAMSTAIPYSVMALKKGLLSFGTKKKEISSLKRLRISTTFGALFFGLFMGFPSLYHDGAFHAKGILSVLLIGAAWGILFYFMFVGFMKLSEKKADEIVEKAGVQNEE